MLITYERRQVREAFGPCELNLDILANLDQTIDAVCAELERRGEKDLVDQQCPYFGVIWSSARFLARYVATMGETLRGKRVLELGCGLAIPSLIAAKSGADVLATDYHEAVPGFLVRNAQLNGAVVRYTEWNWHIDPPTFAADFDYIFGSDLLYDAALPEPLAATIARVASPTTRVVIADPGRFYLQKFMDAMQAHGFALTGESRLGHPTESGDKEYVLCYGRNVG